MNINKRKISYFYDDRIGNYNYGDKHPMKLNRQRLTDHLIQKFRLYKKMRVFSEINLLTADEMVKFHDEEYIDFLQKIKPANEALFKAEKEKFFDQSFDPEDCPVFDRLFEFCQVYGGTSMRAAERLSLAEDDIVINWSGGAHHAKFNQAAGYCYINDIVLSIKHLLKKFHRILYIDIDIHHCDGVESAFKNSNKVLTLSFHKGGDFYPKTGKMADIGLNKGKFYSVNFPFEEGTNDHNFYSAFEPITDKAVLRFDPDVILMQCGADSLAKDPLGCFNVSTRGHSECLNKVIKFGKPLMVVGGGGYNALNVARCWANETAVCLGENLADEIPENDYMDRFMPDLKLHVESSMYLRDENLGKMESKIGKILENMDNIF